MTRAYISIGSNVEPLRNIRAAMDDLRREFGRMEASPVYESHAMGFAGDNFYNLVARFDTTQSAYLVNRILHRIEQQNGRERGLERFSARTLDLDLILYGDLCLNASGLCLPRPDILKYAFVLRPLADLAPEECHPVSGERYVDLWAAFDKGGQALWEVKLKL